jgi:HSP20 family molecular chaperone IbpA
MKLTIKKENGDGAPVFLGTRTKQQWVRALQASLGELGEGALQLLNGTLPYVPRIQVRETEEEVVVRASLPGIDHASIEVLLEPSSLVVRGTSIRELEKQRRNYQRVTKLCRTFDRAITIHGEIERSGVVATMRRDILTVRLPKADAASLPVQRIAVAADSPHGNNSPVAPSRENTAT